MRKLPAILAETTPSQLHGSGMPVELVAEAGGENKLPRFKMLAYTGGLMNLAGWWRPVVVQLSGIKAAGKSVPILRQHDPARIIGHTDSVKIDSNGIRVEGVISGTATDAQEVTASSKNGFPWQASIGANPDRVEYVDEGKTVKVNGETFTGPLCVVRAATLFEVSFVPIGADGNTSASVAANRKENSIMFEQWLQANGFDKATLSAERLKFLEAAFKANIDAAALNELKASWEPKAEKPVKPVRAKKDDAAEQVIILPDQEAIDATIRASREAMAAETERAAKIRTLCAGKHPVIEANAIRENWSPEKTELEVMRASRPQAPAGHVHDNNTSSEVIEAALATHLGIRNLDKQYKPETLEAAHKRHRNIGINEVLLMAATANGFSAGPGARVHAGNIREVLEYAMPHRGVQAAFSSLSLPGILSNVANKELLAGYMEEDQSWREISAVKPVNDFKQVTSYRLLDNMEYEELAPDGHIKHGTVGEESYTRQAKTYAKMFSITRTDIINDDLGAFDDLKNRLGRGAAQKFNKIFWAEFVNNSAFFTSARLNYISGATTTLLTDGVGLGLGVKAFRTLKSPAADGSKQLGVSIGGQPSILLVPPELEAAAEILFRNTNLGGVASSSANIYANKYRPVVVPYLSDSNFTGYSATAWYLLRAPGQMAAVVASFLNGQQTPTVESADADFDQLGVQFRGYHDFGVDQAEYLAGIKSKGSA